MLKLIIAGNGRLMNSIASKMITRCFRKILGCKTAKATCKDICIVDNGSDRLIVHFNGDIDMSKEELLRLLDTKLGEIE